MERISHRKYYILIEKIFYLNSNSESLFIEIMTLLHLKMTNFGETNVFTKKGMLNFLVVIMSCLLFISDYETVFDCLLNSDLSI